jgi:hypothetical protein
MRALVAAVLLLAGPAGAADNGPPSSYGTTYGTGRLPAPGAAAPPMPGFNSYGWSYAKNGGYGSSFKPSGGYGSAAGPSYNTGTGAPATQTIPNYAAGFGASNGSFFNPGTPSSGAGNTFGSGLNQNNQPAPNAR